MHTPRHFAAIAAFLSLFTIHHSLFCAADATPPTLSIESIAGPITPVEIQAFKNFMAAQKMPPAPWLPSHNAWSFGSGGRNIEAMGMMYEATGDIEILNLMITWCDTCVSQRNDLLPADKGGQRVMWTGKIDKVWCPESPTHKNAQYAGCETEDAIAHIAYCAKLILQHPRIWNIIVPDNDPRSCGATYLDRAKNYIAKCDESNDEYFLKWFVQPGTNLIRDPENQPVWARINNNVDSINRQMMFDGGYQRLAECHEILGDAPERVRRYDAIVKASVAECLEGIKKFDPKIVNGVPVYNWHYFPWSANRNQSESTGHAAYDILGIHRAWTRPAYQIPTADVAPLANTLVHVITKGPNAFAGMVNGQGRTDNYLHGEWILCADWNPAAYDIVANAAIASGRYKTNASLTAYVLWEKNKRHLAATQRTSNNTPAEKNTAASNTEPPPRWTIDPADGGITWAIQRAPRPPRETLAPNAPPPPEYAPHTDRIEMAGLHIAAIVTYGIDNLGAPTLSRQLIWPMLRYEPNKTRDHLDITFVDSPRIIINGSSAPREIVTRIHHRGIITIESRFPQRNAGDIILTRELFPSPDKPAYIERCTFKNTGDADITIELEDTVKTIHPNASRTPIYDTGYTAISAVINPGPRKLAPGQTATCAYVISAQKNSDYAATPLARNIDPDAELAARRARVNYCLDNLILDTPDPVLNTAFAFAKIRVTESVFDTAAGLMQGPGGGAYYAAIWANDQAEYAGPFTPYLGDKYGDGSSLNAYRTFAKYMNPQYKPIPSSITGEGKTIWQGAGDRGDMAMIAYGAARFALARGDKQTAAELWPLIEWCLEYCHRKIDSRGVVASDSDELENRFPAGKANLCTSTLYYDALLSAAYLGHDLGKPAAQLDAYRSQAGSLRNAIEKHFGSNVEGYDTYRYYDKTDYANAAAGKPENARLARHAAYYNRPDILRAWICMPLTVGIYDRAKTTTDALFSPRLWTDDGLATEAGQITYWDRSTLYALRGVFAAGETKRALDFLKFYSARRLLGEHVPYPIEAWPEGNQRHLSTESGLYCRIYTEGIFGIRPTGLRSFACTPRLPAEWPRMTLKRVKAFGDTFDLTVERAGSQLKIIVTRENHPIITKTITLNESADINL